VAERLITFTLEAVCRTAPVCRPVDLGSDGAGRSRFDRTTDRGRDSWLTRGQARAMHITLDDAAPVAAAAPGEPVAAPTTIILGDRSPCTATSLSCLIVRVRWSPCFRGGPARRYAGCRRSRLRPNRLRARAGGTDHDVIGTNLPMTDTNQQAGASGNVTVSIPQM